MRFNCAFDLHGKIQQRNSPILIDKLSRRWDESGEVRKFVVQYLTWKLGALEVLIIKILHIIAFICARNVFLKRLLKANYSILNEIQPVEKYKSEHKL